ncbi:MAG TPA: hypothetical protein VLR47_06655, partial [Rhodospirillales bacterium]|nr:hypothetical protein [Rhodospirillales bacterium]
GTQGLVPVAWDRSLEQWGARQLQSRFQRQAGRAMTGIGYAAWAAVRTIGPGLAKPRLGPGVKRGLAPPRRAGPGAAARAAGSPAGRGDGRPRRAEPGRIVDDVHALAAGGIAVLWATLWSTRFAPATGSSSCIRGPSAPMASAMPCSALAAPVPSPRPSPRWPAPTRRRRSWHEGAGLDHLPLGHPDP